MECKDHLPHSSFRPSVRIDLTRMECKVSSERIINRRTIGIDLTRMECKDNWGRCKSCRASKYRFNQNGM